MSSPATVSEYGKYIDLQRYTATAPAASGSIYLSGAAGSELVRTNVGLSAAGSVTAVGSFIIGSADMSEADLEKLDGITNGTVAADKAVVVDSNKDASGFRNVTAEGSFIIGSADLNETDMEKLDGITNGTVAASKAVVVDANKDASGFRHVTATGAVTAGTSFIIGSADLNETDLEKLDGITDGTAAANKALVLDSNKDASGLRNLTMTGDMTAGTVTMTGFTVDADGDTALKSLAVDDGSTIGCDSDTDLMSLADGALTVNGTLSADTSFTLDSTTLDATELGYLDGVTAGTAAASKALVLDANKAVGTITSLTATYAQIDVLDVNTINSVTATATDLEVSDRRIIAALSASSALADGGGLRIGGGASTAGHAAVLYDHANSALDFNIGGTTEVRLQDGVLRPETDNDVDLGASGAEFKDLYLDGVAYVDELRADQLGAALDANNQAITNINVDSGAIDGTVIGANSAAAGTFAALVGTSLSVSDGNITNVGDIALDSISADGADIDLNLPDNQAAALDITQGGTSYMKFVTTDGQEYIQVGKQASFAMGASIEDDQVLNLGSNGNESHLKYISADNILEMSGTANGLRFSGSADFGQYGIQAGTVAFGAATVTSLSVRDGNITNVGNIALDSISADGTDIDLSLTDNRSAALEIKEGSDNYMVFDTTNGQEGIFLHKEAEFYEGLLVQDDKKVTFGDDDDGSIQFVSAANVVRFDGGSAGLHFNDTSAFGADGSGKDVTFHGGAASEKMEYVAADHRLKFTDASSVTWLQLGGDATSEYAVDVADGSNAQNKIRAAAFVTYSDERLKTDVTAIDNGLETVNNLKAVNFTWKKDGSRDFGFMAQELKQVVPQAVHGTDEGLYGVDYGRLSAILVSAIQEQSAQIASLKKQLENK
tara:strand:- start:19 stop:2706 length:2688 start_codon:yes stop_codon:yes gene_type:complete